MHAKRTPLTTTTYVAADGSTVSFTLSTKVPALITHAENMAQAMADNRSFPEHWGRWGRSGLSYRPRFCSQILGLGTMGTMGTMISYLNGENVGAWPAEVGLGPDAGARMTQSAISVRKRPRARRERGSPLGIDRELHVNYKDAQDPRSLPSPMSPLRSEEHAAGAAVADRSGPLPPHGPPTS